MVRVEKSLGVRRWTSVRLSADWWASTKRQTAPRRHRSGSLAADENCADQSPKSSSWHESDSYGDPTHLNLEKLNCIRQTGFIVRWKIFMKLVPWWIFHLMKINERPSQWKGTQSGQIISGNPASYPDENPQYPTIPVSSLDSSWSWNKSRRCLGWFYYSFEMNFIFCIFPFFKKMSLNGGNPIVSITRQRAL